MQTPKGTPLKDRDFAEGRVLTTAWKHKAEYAWDWGWAMGGYLQGLKEGRLRGVRCRGCNRILVPPRAFCENCFRPLSEWVDVRDTGVVNTFSRCYVSWDMKRLETPLIPAVIEIDGASTGMGIMHHLGGVDPEQVRIGLRVRAVWRPAVERRASITDIRYFEPL